MRRDKPKIEQLVKKSFFSEDMARHNGLFECGFAAWAFYPGMLFGSEEKWWNDGGKRKRPHEGLDLCFYRDKTCAVRSIDKYAKIPVMFAGEIVRITDDFLGQSVFVRHDSCEGDMQLHTIYGHVQPLHEDCRTVDEGDAIAVIADAHAKQKGFPAHLHLSVAWITKSLPEKVLSWETINNSLQCRLLDPLDVMQCRYTTI